MENSWVFPALEALHVVGLALLMGTIMLGDLRVLGLTKAAAPGQLFNVGLGLMILTGVAMFVADAPRYTQNPAFLLKMAVLVIAFGTHFYIRKRATRGTAILSIALWTFAVLAARAVIDFDA